ncbi:MAG: hypothetical protein EOM28_12485 [Clostridia bacterium]|nr:hypothetical protein [Clostridia bacterium]
MIIDGLKLPEDTSIVIEKQNFDTNRRTVSGRMITKLAPMEKWKITIHFENKTLSLEFQKAFYTKCLEMRSAYGVVSFINPYTGEEVTAKMKCTSKKTPSPLDVVRGRSRAYKTIGATFEEV